jgi:four helix bundle protein
MTNDQVQMTHEKKSEFDLGERTARFGESVIDFARAINVTVVKGVLIRQLVRAATSVGANYSEADDADTKKDFTYKIGVCKREAKESKHWLRMIVRADPEQRANVAPLWKEADELARIFAAIVNSAKKENEN